MIDNKDFDLMKKKNSDLMKEKNFGANRGARVCKRCNEDFSFENIFTKMGQRECQISGFCEICFETFTSESGESREEIIDRLNKRKRCENIASGYNLFRSGETIEQAKQRISLSADIDLDEIDIYFVFKTTRIYEEFYVEDVFIKYD